MLFKKHCLLAASLSFLICCIFVACIPIKHAPYKIKKSIRPNAINDTLTYSIIEWLDKRDTLHLSHDVLANDLAQNGTIDTNSLSILKSPENVDFQIKIIDQHIHITMNRPFGETITYQICDQQQLCDTAHLSLFPCDREAYERKQAMPASQGHFVITNDSTLHIPLKKGEKIDYKGLAKIQQTPTTFIYTPLPNFIGKDHLSYYRKQVFSPCGGSFETPGWFEIYVTPNHQQNTVPIAVNDTIILLSKQKKENLIFPLNNDIDEKGLAQYSNVTLKIDSIFSVAHGLAKKHDNNNTISYYPPKTDLRSDTIIYGIKDNNGLKSSAKILIYFK